MKLELVESLAKERGQWPAPFETEFFQHGRPTSLIERFASTQEVAARLTCIASPLASATPGAAAGRRRRRQERILMPEGAACSDC